MVYCDENSEVVNKTVECTTTTLTPEVFIINIYKKIYIYSSLTSQFEQL